MRKWGNLIFGEGAMTIQWRNDSLMSKWFKDNWICIYIYKTESWPKFHTLYKNLRKITKWTICSSVKSKTINLFEKKNLQDQVLDKMIFVMTSKHNPQKIKYFIKSKNACSMKDTIKTMEKTNHRIAGNIFTMYFHQRVVFRIQWLSKLSRKKTSSPVGKWFTQIFCGRAMC